MATCLFSMANLCKANVNDGVCGDLCDRLGGTYCAFHNHAILGVMVHRSLKKDMSGEAMAGLYATIAHKKDSVIEEYVGELHTLQSLNEKYFRKGENYGPYVLQIDANKYIDASSLNSSCVRFINDYRCLSDNDNIVVKPNCKFQLCHSGVWGNFMNVVAVRKIHPMEELFIDYGEDYWAAYFN